MKAQPLVVYLPDTRGVAISPYGRGNLKIGMSVYTYSRLPGKRTALGHPSPYAPMGTCPGATEECEDICYARRPVMEQGVVYQMWAQNSRSSDVPPIPEDCTHLRIHVSGDFDSIDYIFNWYQRLQARPDVTAWAYTRSWRVPSLRVALEDLRTLPNVQLFASMDSSTQDVPPKGWRRAWIEGDYRVQPFKWRNDLTVNPTTRGEGRLTNVFQVDRVNNQLTVARTSSYVCPEETGHKQDCLSCRYCFDGTKNDVTFLRH